MKAQGLSKRLFEDQFDFVHLTFVEYLAAHYIVQCFEQPENTPLRKQAEEAVLEYRYHSKFEVMWWFVAGLLNNSYLERFFDLLLGNSNELIGIYPLCLGVRCLEESKLPKVSYKAKLLEKAVAFTEYLFFNGSMLPNYRGWITTLKYSKQFYQVTGIPNIIVRTLHDPEIHKEFETILASGIRYFIKNIGDISPNVVSSLVATSKQFVDGNCVVLSELVEINQNLLTKEIIQIAIEISRSRARVLNRDREIAISPIKILEHAESKDSYVLKWFISLLNGSDDFPTEGEIVICKYLIKLSKENIISLNESITTEICLVMARSK